VLDGNVETSVPELQDHRSNLFVRLAPRLPHTASHFSFFNSSRRFPWHIQQCLAHQPLKLTEACFSKISRTCPRFPACIPDDQFPHFREQRAGGSASSSSLFVPLCLHHRREMASWKFQESVILS